MNDALFDRLLKIFLRQHPEHHASYRVLPTGEAQMQPALYRAFAWWLRKKGSITVQQAMAMETFARELEHGQHPWIEQQSARDADD